MISFFVKHKKVIFITTTAVFLVGIFVGLGGYLYTSSGSSDAVAKIDDTVIPYNRYIAKVNSALDEIKDKQQADVPDVLYKYVKREVFREMVVQEALALSAQEYGLWISDFELAAEIRSVPQFYRNGAFSAEAYARFVVAQLKMSPSEYEQERRKSRLAMRFQRLVFSAVKHTPVDIERAYLAKHKDMKSFEKDKEQFTKELVQEEAVALMNYYLTQYMTRHKFQDFLDIREKGQ